MSLQDAPAGIPERLINGLDYSQLGTKFEAVTSKEDVHFSQPLVISSHLMVSACCVLIW